MQYVAWQWHAWSPPGTLSDPAQRVEPLLAGRSRGFSCPRRYGAERSARCSLFPATGYSAADPRRRAVGPGPTTWSDGRQQSMGLVGQDGVVMRVRRALSADARSGIAVPRPGA